MSILGDTLSIVKKSFFLSSNNKFYTKVGKLIA